MSESKGRDRTMIQPGFLDDYLQHTHNSSHGDGSHNAGDEMMAD